MTVYVKPSHRNGQTANKHGSSWIRREKRLAIYLRDGFRCLACERDLHGADPREVTLDHIVSRGKGGSHHASNLYTCCLSCNSSRQDKPLHRFVDSVTRGIIRRHARRKLGRYLRLAKDIIAASPQGAGEGCIS